MGPRVPRIVLLCVLAIVTVAIFALAPFYTPSVMAALHDDPFEPPHQCGGA